MKPIVKQIIIFFLFAGTAFTQINAQANDSYFLHTVEKGQSLYSIASMYNVPIDSIVEANPGSKETIKAGAQLRIPNIKSTENKSTEQFHTILPGETLYRLSTLYGVTVKEICEANPGLTAANFKSGEVVRIPAPAPQKEEATTNPATTATKNNAISPCKTMHKVARKETIYSISREYGITEKELVAANPELAKGLKRGKFLCIPHPQADSSKPKPEGLQGGDKVQTNNELFNANKPKAEKYKSINAALLLPFQQDKRMVEYYEGFLIAIDSLKRTGVSINLHVFNCDEKTESLEAVLKKSEMKKMNIIFGPAQSAHTKRLATFAKNNNINLVIPFSSREDEVFTNPLVYQINTPQSYLYSEVYSHFVQQFRNANVIFLDAGDADKSKRSFIEGLKTELKQNNIPYKALPETASVEGLKGALVEGKQNIFIPTSGSDVTLIRILPHLKLLVRENPEEQIHLFGYPEWQTYTNDHLESFFELDTYFYSSFYTNNLLPAAIQFTNSYHKWYSKDMENIYPKYAMLGYDTAFFFLKGLWLYGSDFDDNISKMNIRPIQTGFNFQRVNNWGGFINKKVFFVRFSKNYELIKIDFE